MQLSQSQASSILNISMSRSVYPQEHLISKILELEAKLYQSSIENQQLRIKNKDLQLEYAQKKELLLEGQRPIKVCSVAKHKRNSSLSSVLSSQEHPRESMASTKPSAFASVQPRQMHIITGLEPNFEALKEVQNECSYNSHSASQLSSPRSTGIRKNIKSPRIAGKDQSSIVGFKTI